MSKCKTSIPETTSKCGMEIRWKYEYLKVPAGVKNRALNPDGSPHWPNCKGNPNRTEYFTQEKKEIPSSSSPSPSTSPPKVTTDPSYFSDRDITNDLKPEFETADSRLKFERTYKLVEMTISKTRKCNEKTIPQLAQFESLDYFISTKTECELGADFQKIAWEKFAEINLAIENEIQADRLRLSGLKEE